MQATALVCDSSMQFSLEKVVLPELEKDDVLVKVAYSGVSIGTELALIRKKLSWGPFPIVTGYMATGTVEAVGSDVTDLKPGGKVYARNNRKMNLANGTSISPVSGTHCSHLVTRAAGTHGVGRLPEEADMRTSCMFVMPAVGYSGVDMSEPKMGQSVVVYGCGPIGLGVVAAASLRGCKVIGIDLQDRQLEMAKAMGADVLINSSKDDPAEVLKTICPEGADVVFECTGVPTLIDKAIALCKTFGKFVWQGNYGQQPISFAFLIPHGKQLQTFFPCDDGYQPCRRTVVKHMTAGILPWEKTITHHVSASEAADLYRRINQGDKEIVSATIQWS